MARRIDAYARIIVVLAVFMGSTSGILGKLITADPMAIGFFRLTFALPFFVLPVLFSRRDALRAVPRRDFLLSALSGMFLFWHFLFWFMAVKATSVASAIILADLHPLVVMALTTLFLKKHVPAKAVLGVLTALAGGVLVMGTDLWTGGNSLAGDLLALAPAVTMAVYFTIGGQVRRRMAGDLYILIVFSSCWMFFAVGMLLTNTPVVGYPASDYLWLLVMTALCQLGAHAVMNWSMAHVSALYVSAWGTAEIVSAPVLAFLVLGEVPGPFKIVGGLIVIGGLLYYNYHEPHTPPS